MDVEVATWSCIKFQLGQSERPSTTYRTRNHERYSSFVGNKVYIQANGGTRDRQQEGHESVGSGFAIGGMHISCITSRSTVAAFTSSRFLSTDKQHPDVQCLFVVSAELSWPHDDEPKEAMTTVDRLLMGS
jgi:hypothetical protein